LHADALVARFCALLFGAGRKYDLVPTRANGQPAFGLYVHARGGIRRGTGLVVLTLAGNRICAMTRFENSVLLLTREATGRTSSRAMSEPRAGMVGRATGLPRGAVPLKGRHLGVLPSRLPVLPACRIAAGPMPWPRAGLCVERSRPPMSYLRCAGPH